MTPERLRQIRERLAAIDDYCVRWNRPPAKSPWQLTTLSFFDSSGWSWGCADVARDLLGNAPGDLADLIAYVEELHRVIHDASQDGGFALGERRERARVLRLIEAARSVTTGNSKRGRALGRLLGAVKSGGPSLPLSADELAAENDRLRRRVEELERLTQVEQ